MTDLRDRFRKLDAARTPDLWPEIQGRAAMASRPRASSRWALLIVAVLLFLAAAGAALIGSGVVKLPLLVDTMSMTPSPTIEESLSASPSPVPIRPFTNLEAYQAWLVSDTVGWVKTTSSLYRTSDDGRMWNEVALPSDAVAALAVHDETTAYAAYFKGQGWEIAATHDAGSSWTQVGVDALGEAAVPTFAVHTPMSAQVIFPTTGKVFETQDGGASWSGVLTETKPKVGDQLFKAPVGDRGVMAYSNGKYDNRPFDDLLWVSTDGGVTWTRLSFPTDSASPKGVGKNLAATPWIDNTRILIAVHVWDVGSVAFYESVDTGQSWRFIAKIPNWEGTVTFLSPSVWVGCSNGTGARCWSTEDAGATWRQSAGLDLPYLRGTITFASADHAWSVIDCREYAYSGSFKPSYCTASVQSVLLETIDGGDTWRPIE